MVIYYHLKNGSRNPCIYLINYVLLRDKNGKWQSKTEKEYLCVKNGEEKGFMAAEFKTTQNDGWEKQYQYFVGKKKVYMPPLRKHLKNYAVQ